MKECDQNTTILLDQDTLSLKISEANTSSASEGLPLLNLSILKHDQHRPQKCDRYANITPEVFPVSKTGKSDDNQKTHLSCKHRIAHNAAKNCSKAKRWACDVDSEESLLPNIVLRPTALSSQKLSPAVLRKIYPRRTWNGALKPQQGYDFRSTLQRRVSSSDDTILTFEATETILLAEIDSDERCASFLRERAPRQTLVSHPDRDHSSQIQYKLRDFDRKIQMNSSGPRESQNWEKSGHDEDQHSKLPDQQKSKSRKFLSVAAVVIQCAFRAFRARCQLVDLLAKTYQRVLSPDNNQYFYYNRITGLSQWEAPLLLHRCHYSLDANQKSTATLVNPTTNIDTTLNAAAKVIQIMFRQRALRVFMQDLKLGNLEKVFDAGFGAWYYFNSRTNHSFWGNVHHVKLTAANSAIYHRHQSS